MNHPPQFPDYLEPVAPQWRRWWLALLLLWGVQAGLTLSLWPDGRPRQELWLWSALPPLAWLLALALRALVWQVALVNREAYRATLDAALQRWWRRRSAALPVEHVLLLGPAGDSPWQYQGLMAATPMPLAAVPPGALEPALRCQLSLRETPERSAALGRHLAHLVLALPGREARWAGLRGLAWAGDAAGEAAFVQTLAAGGAPLPEGRWSLRTLEDLDALIDAFPRTCPREADALLCAGVVSLERAEAGVLPGEAGFVWLVGHPGRQRVHRGEYLRAGGAESVADLCAQMQRYGGLNGAPTDCLALDVASQVAFVEGGWLASEHQLAGHWGALGELAPFVGMSLAVLRTQESGQACGWLCAEGERGMAMGVVVANDNG